MARHRLMTTLLALALPLSAAQASAESPIPPGRSALASALERHPASDTGTEARTGWLRYVRIRKGAGFEIRRSVGIGEHGVILGVKGPVMKRKRLGLTFEVRF